MTTRRGAARGSGKGYRNLRGFPKDPLVHSQSSRGMKQPQKIPQYHHFRPFFTKTEKEIFGKLKYPEKGVAIKKSRKNKAMIDNWRNELISKLANKHPEIPIVNIYKIVDEEAKYLERFYVPDIYEVNYRKVHDLRKEEGLEQAEKIIQKNIMR